MTDIIQKFKQISDANNFTEDERAYFLDQWVNNLSRVIEYLPDNSQLWDDETIQSAYAAVNPPSLEALAEQIKTSYALTLENSPEPASDPNFLKPYYPQIFIGRDKDVVNIKTRLGVETNKPPEPITVIRGWPGVGKTTFVNRLAHDEALIRHFSDGVLWSSLGKNANLFGALKSWLNQLDTFYSGQDKTIDDLVNRLRATLQGKNVLLIVDDLWTKEDGEIFKRVITEKNTLMITTRFTAIAKELAEVPENVYLLDVLSDEDSLKLLRRLAPEAVKKHERSLGGLIKTLEGLPLALRVAGNLLEKEQTLSVKVEGLIQELTEKYYWVQETAPTTYFDEETGQTPSITLSFQKSVETLQPAEQVAFANLGMFASKPATFDLNAIAYVCELDDPIPTVKSLVDHGLLEPLGSARFQMHYTLSMYAKSLQEPEDDDYEIDEEE